jgi:hypothetical protein
MTTMTRVRLNNGRFGTVKRLFTGNGHAPIEVNGKPLGVWRKEQGQAGWNRLVEKGKLLMLEAGKFIGLRHDEAGALDVMAGDRKACAAYLTQEKVKRCRRFVHISEGFDELSVVEASLAAKVAVTDRRTG